ncbi:MAG: hypothetical protein JXQ65_16390 [Candidatus Marinimicrobia bacterium]|nr:hypothetical protein [Candidatus Neomarinimicrobiota bacterium]
MNWYIVAINFLILLGISIFYGNKKDFQLTGGKGHFCLGLSGLTVLLSSEILLLLYWLGSLPSILALEISMIISLPVAFYFLKPGKSACNLLSDRLRHPENMALNSIYLVAYLFIKLTLVLLSSVFLLVNILGWNSISTLVAVIMMVATFTIFGNFQSLVMTQLFQMIFIFASVITLIILPSKSQLSPQSILSPVSINIPLWKITAVGFLYGIFQWTFEQQLFQRTSRVKSKAFIPILAITKFMLIMSILLSPHYSSHTVQNFIVNIGILSLLMASLANIGNSIASLVVEDFYRNIKPAENPWEGELITKIIITGVAFISVLLVLIMKNSTLGLVVRFFGVWLNFSVLTIILVFFSQMKIVNLSTIIISYFVGTGIHILPLITDNQIVNKYSTCNIFDQTLRLAGITTIIIFIGYLFSFIPMNNWKLHKKEFSNQQLK